MTGMKASIGAFPNLDIWNERYTKDSLLLSKIHFWIRRNCMDLTVNIDCVKVSDVICHENLLAILENDRPSLLTTDAF